MQSTSTKKYKRRSPNAIRYINSCGNEGDTGKPISPNLAPAHVFGIVCPKKNGGYVLLFGPNKKPFLMATIQT